MKRLLTILFVVCASVLMVACSSPERKGRKYAKELIEARDAGDKERMSEIFREANEYEKSLSAEDEEVFVKAFYEELDKHK